MGAWRAKAEKETPCSYNEGCRRAGGGRGKGSGASLVSQLSQQGLKRVKSPGREMFVRVCFPA